MTTKPTVTGREAARLLPPLPDPPRYDMEQTHYFLLPGVMGTLALHLGAMDPGSGTLVSGNGYLCRRRSDLPSCPYPDMLVAFDIDKEGVNVTNGYVIEEVGKPPDLLMEVASKSTGRRDHTIKRDIYAEMRVPEYWRFDHTGGRYHDAGLAGDVLAPDNTYQPVALTTQPDGSIWGFSEVLGLSVCWVEGSLRFWDGKQQRYLPTQEELIQTVSEARAHVSGADARIRQLEEEVRRLRGP